ncbi:Uma2 family endonuclease [Larkinella terrae]|uniref:Uma2 family endonuclease n=1 Tax=Larkinella terrae TaxID=2025311 RepID=A0A7K0EVA4_9BACT|nr:Uma2 family endonuclease [Larkinella terrae]MRS65740.1 Uma2 family endonuclease [Larkinella terrae]
MTIPIVTEEPRRRRKIPTSLIYETLNGKPLYYRDYKEVLSGKKTPEEVMGSSSLQAALVSLIHGFLFNNINRKLYLLVTNESGVHVDKGNNLSNDIAIFAKKGLILNNKYFDRPPKVAIEIDVRIDLENFPSRDQSYIYEKTERLLDFGVERVIWITTQPQKIFIASRAADWTTHNWDINIPVLDTCVLNLAELLREEGIEF